MRGGLTFDKMKISKKSMLIFNQLCVFKNVFVFLSDTNDKKI